MTVRLLVQCAVSFAAVMAFAILFHAPRREWVPCGLTGTLGLALLSRVLAVVRRCPVTVFLTGGIFPLVPGAGIYYTVYAFITGDNAAAVFKGVETLKIAGVIALGIVLVLALPKGVFRVFAAREKRQ